MSWTEFWDMGGYGFYVWGSYGLTLLCLACEVVVLKRRARALQAQVRQTREPKRGER